MGGNSTDGPAPAARPEIVLMRGAMAKLRRRIADLEAFDPNRIENRKDPSIEALSKAIDGTLLVVSGEVARFLRKAELDAILMHEQGSEALTDIERLERHSGVGFAVVLLPPEEDEKAAVANGAHRPRGRGALVAELYYFAGKLGRGRVCALTTSETAAAPVTGISYATYDPYEGWQKVLLKALEEAGYTVDWGKALR